MKRHTRLFLFAVFLFPAVFAVLVALAVLPTIEDTWTVNAWDPDGIIVDDDYADCPNADATTIQGGVDLASPGEKIRVCPGTYAGGVIVDKAGVRLKGKGPLGAVKVVGTGGGGPKFGFTITADNVRIERFEIKGFAGQHDASGIFVGGLFAGDTANPADGAVIERNNIHDNGNGIYLWQSNGNRIRKNEVHHNKDNDGDEGTGVLSFNGFGDAQTLAANAAGRSGKNNEISRNVVHDNDRLGIFAGACTEAAFGCVGPTGVHANISGTKIRYNDVFGNGALGTTEGIGLLDAHGGRIEDNDVHDNKLHGILINFSDGATVVENGASDNSTAFPGFSGIRINGSSGIVVNENDTDDNGRGIRMTGSTGGVFKKNSAFGNAVVDLDWDSTGVHTFSKNKCGTAIPSKAAWDCT